MRQIAILGATVTAILCCNCVCGDWDLIWTVEGEVVQAGTESPLAGEIVNFRLFRDGETIAREDRVPLEPDGGFELTAYLGSSGSCGLIFLPLTPNTPLGEPPDEIELVVLTPDGDRLSIVVPVLEENIGEIVEFQGVEVSGVISLGQIVVGDDE